jgi:hypothetical protein
MLLTTTLLLQLSALTKRSKKKYSAHKGSREHVDEEGMVVLLFLPFFIGPQGQWFQGLELLPDSVVTLHDGIH